MQQFSLVIHGGAGTILKADMSPELEQAYQNGLQEALNAGYSILQNGGSAVDAIQASIFTLENNILFNAGKGSYQKRVARNGRCHYGRCYFRGRCHRCCAQC